MTHHHGPRHKLQSQREAVRIAAKRLEAELKELERQHDAAQQPLLF